MFEPNGLKHPSPVLSASLRRNRPLSTKHRSDFYRSRGAAALRLRKNPHRRRDRGSLYRRLPAREDACHAASSIIFATSQCFTLANITHKTLQHAPRRVWSLRVELYAVEAFSSLAIMANGLSVLATVTKVGRNRRHFITVAHPDIKQRFAIGGRESSIPRTSALSEPTLRPARNQIHAH